MNIILFAVLFFVKADHIPEFKAALDFQQINSFKQHLLKPIIDLIQGTHLPLDIQWNQSIPLIGKVELDIYEVFLLELTLNWDDAFILPYQNKEDSIILQTRSTNITIQAYTRLVFGGLQLLNTGTVYKLQNLNFSLVIQFDPTTSKRSWGFKPIIKDVQIDLTRMYFIMDNVIQPLQAGINLFVDILTPIIVKQTKKIILKVASPALGVLSQNQRLQIAQQYGAYMYQFQITFTQPPSIVYEQTTYMSLQLDIQIENVYTGNVCPIFDTGSLPNRVHSNQALELIFSDIIIDQLLWVLIDSKMLDLTIDDSMYQNIDQSILLTLHKYVGSLTTNGMSYIFPDFYEAYRSGKGIYVRIYGQTAQQQMYIRKNRLQGVMTVMLDIIVDTESNNYPGDKADCKSCVIAYTAEVQLGVMATLYNKSPELFAASVMLVKIIDIDQTGGELLTIEQLNFLQKINSIIGETLPLINQKLNKGIENPFIGFFGPKEINITMGDSFMSLGVVFKE